jgi:[ribosomal protein S18]-alanine N-acetyltransferase
MPIELRSLQTAHLVPLATLAHEISAGLDLAQVRFAASQSPTPNLRAPYTLALVACPHSPPSSSEPAFAPTLPPASNTSPHTVAERAPVALLVIEGVTDEAELIALGTLPDWRRQGIARQLLSHAIDTLRASGTRQLHLEVSALNNSAARLYTSLGFSQTGIRRRYYRDGSDALLLSLELTRLR